MEMKEQNFFVHPLSFSQYLGETQIREHWSMCFIYANLVPGHTLEIYQVLDHEFMVLCEISKLYLVSC